MPRAWWLGLVASISGCTALSGLDDLAISGAGHTDTPALDGGVDGNAAQSGDGSTADRPPARTGWAHRRPITLSNDTTGTLTSHAVLVVVPATFTYEKAKPDGADIRFSTTEDEGNDLPYFIESWQPGGTSFVWVVPPSIPPGASVLRMFYGNASAPAVSRFDVVFPRAQRTAGGGEGGFTATGDIDVDWFELRAGDTLTLAPGAPLTISARRIVIAGVIQGDGRGHGGGPDAANLGGKGPGGGAAATDASGSGGGGHGGAGGRGGADSGNTGGAGGATYGSDTDHSAEMGSGGAAANSPAGFKAGGAGGGALRLLGWRTTVSGTISANGADGIGGGARNAGGGAGGSIVAGASFLDLAGASLSAKGGAGGPCAASGHDGGGGGGGGRIKLHARGGGGFVGAASMNVGFGPGGAGAGTSAPGADGIAGTTTVNESSNALTGVATSLGAEL